MRHLQQRAVPLKILRHPPTVHAWTPIKVAMVTGLSDPRTCALSPPQRRLLDSLSIPAEWKVVQNFPFISTDAVPTCGILRASMANALQFLRAGSREYRGAARPHWQALLDSTDQLLLVTGSCGLELVRAGLPPDTNARVEVLALGPVSRCTMQYPTTTLQGSRDWISRIFHRNVDRTIPQVAHMHYWYSQEVKEFAHQWLHNRISACLDREVISRTNA